MKPNLPAAKAPSGRGKPKGICRKLTAELDLFADKVAVSEVGECALSDEFDLVEEVRMHAALLKACGAKGSSDPRCAVIAVLRDEIVSLFVAAVETNDGEFFRRCGLAVTKQVSGRVDPNAYNVLRAIQDLSISQEAAITPSMIIRKMEELFGTSDTNSSYSEPRNLRKLLKTLGLKCPIQPWEVKPTLEAMAIAPWLRLKTFLEYRAPSGLRPAGPIQS